MYESVIRQLCSGIIHVMDYKYLRDLLTKGEVGVMMNTQSNIEVTPVLCVWLSFSVIPTVN